jgi:hypothetical protein
MASRKRNMTEGITEWGIWQFVLFDIFSLFSHGTTAPVGQGLLIVKDSWSLSETPHLVGLLWTSDQPDAETSTWQHNTQERQTYIPLVGFEPAIPASQRPQNHTLDRAATGISI